LGRYVNKCTSTSSFYTHPLHVNRNRDGMREQYDVHDNFEFPVDHNFQGKTFGIVLYIYLNTCIIQSRKYSLGFIITCIK